MNHNFLVYEDFVLTCMAFIFFLNILQELIHSWLSFQYCGLNMLRKLSVNLQHCTSQNTMTQLLGEKKGIVKCGYSHFFSVWVRYRIEISSKAKKSHLDLGCYFWNFCHNENLKIFNKSNIVNVLQYIFLL